ncbi:ATP-binding protein [Curvibacter sp. APW13]|uniref:ATP-binding protein n=1 Tax=Curvibacter sp. APW13 TaxID=3077236 RepID=UPI0028E02FA6|nr:ATP-binding protein [Curvibacter sp. APW13]MDT8992349.1 ATP-binding protein [Curvibacter sp. APW13]
MTVPPTLQRLGAWLEGWLPSTLFARLAWLLGATAVVSHVLALTLLFEVFPAFRPPPPPVQTTVWAGPPPAHRPPPGGMPPAGMLMDIGVRVAALLLATWIGARWLASPLKRLAQGAAALGQNLHQGPLPEEGTSECREATRLINQLQRHMLAHLAQRDRFLAAVSHDLRTPLTRLALRAEYLADAAIRERFVRDIAEMEAMVHSTLDYLRGASDTEPYARADLGALVEALVHDLQETGLDVSLGELAHGQTARLQSGAMRRCVGNLVENAVRYGHRARVSLLVRGEELRILVDDDGMGMEESELSRVIEPFYRVDGSRNRHQGGVGLGLSIAHEVAVRHGGQLQLSNRPGGGLRAEVSVPRLT